MTKGLGFVLTLAGMAGLVLGVLGIFGKDVVNINSWALAILGLIFFTSGISLLRARS